MEIEKLKDMLYNATGGSVGIQMCHDAADVIEQLQAENENLLWMQKKYQPKEHWETLNEAVTNLRTDLTRVTLERDAIIKQLHGYCPACSHYTSNCNEGPCDRCKHDYFQYQDIEAEDNWKWRGVEKEV